MNFHYFHCFLWGRVEKCFNCKLISLIVHIMLLWLKKHNNFTGDQIYCLLLLVLYEILYINNANEFAWDIIC